MSQKINDSLILSDADALAQAQQAADKGAHKAVLDEEKELHVPKRDELLMDEAQILVQAANALDRGSEKADRSNTEELDDESDAQSLGQVIDSKIIDEEQQMEENKLKTALVDSME